MSTQPQSLSPASPQVAGPVAPLTPDQRHTIERAVELIVAADGIRTLAEFLQVEPTPDELYPAAFSYTIRLLDQVVAIVDDLTGNTGNEPITLAAGDGR